MEALQEEKEVGHGWASGWAGGWDGEGDDGCSGGIIKLLLRQTFTALFTVEELVSVCMWHWSFGSSCTDRWH